MTFKEQEQFTKKNSDDLLTELSNYQTGKRILFLQRFRQAYFSTPWHFHPEIEIILIVNGYGSRYVGDSIKNFYP
jgi:hypothetical protein